MNILSSTSAIFHWYFENKCYFLLISFFNLFSFFNSIYLYLIFADVVFLPEAFRKKYYRCGLFLNTPSKNEKKNLMSLTSQNRAKLIINQWPRKIVKGLSIQFGEFIAWISYTSIISCKIIYAFLKIVLDNGLARIRCNVLSWNKIAISFYERIGGVIEDDWRQCSFTRRVMRDLINS